MTAVQTVPPPPVSKPHHPIPTGACDTHSHVFGPMDAFPPVHPSVYAIPEASAEAHSRVRAALGLTYGVLTQPAPYGDDPAAILNAISGAQGALRGIAVATPGIDEATLAAWQRGGIVGLRFVETRSPGGTRYPGSVGFEAIEALAERMRAFGLHAQLWASARDYAEWLPRLERIKVPLVIEHLACPDPADDIGQPGFDAVLAGLSSGKLWVKLTPVRVSHQPPLYRDAWPFHDALVAAAPERLLWGSDWPYVRLNPSPDAGNLLDLLFDLVPNEADRHAILVDNPAALYGFR